MKKKTFFLLLMLISSLALKAETTIPSVMEDMIKRAGAEGKLIMLDFYADWCAPCRWMSQTVFQDPEVESLLSSSFLTKMIDIDELDGYELKQRYEVSVLPTILIFNTNGKMIERIEKTVSAGEFLEILELHDTHRNRMKIQHSINTSPASLTNSKESYDIRDNYLRYIESNQKSSRNYRLQMGIYNDYEGAFAKVDKLKDTFLEPIIVVNDYKDKMVRYRVMMGEFSSLSEAESFRKILKNDFSIDAIVN